MIETERALTLYAHPLSSYCWKALIALYEKDIPFSYRQLEPGEMDSVEMQSIWPLGKFPILADGDRIIVETSSIVEYLDLHFPDPVPLLPADPGAAIEVRMLDRIFDHYVMTPMQKIVFDRFCPDEARNRYDVKAARSTLDKAIGWLEGRVAGRVWAAGADFSLADCAAGPSLHYADQIRPIGDEHPNLADYIDRLRARPSFARVLEEARPYAHMFPDKDRD